MFTKLYIPSMLCLIILLHFSSSCSTREKYPHHLQIEPHLTVAATDPHPPGVDPYFRSYSIDHAYNAHHAGGLTYPHTGGLTYPHAIGAALPSTYATDLVAHNWAAEEPVQPYGNTMYTIGATIPQDVSQQLLPVIPTQSAWTNPIPTVQPRGPWKKIPKKTKIAQSAWCEICKIECNTRDVLYKHKLGKKHIKNVEKLNSAASVATTSTTTSNPIIGPVENPKKGNSGTKKKAETSQDLELKRRKVLEGGAAANAVRTCGICNVVSNSDAVFRFHLAGQKHASMSKKLQQAGAV
ncbi:hypothetical protein L1987_74953 [Smallanthus sonchifolius]|uniref:Uncharacterized protein n=1 Tax=Smallanthus sonchifolius TaxID=185202 RepID=A0ACB9A5C3_9ASTR|nr:hypothetical protein L1987_74953 [Smallanthus sonchifolius]